MPLSRRSFLTHSTGLLLGAASASLWLPAAARADTIPVFPEYYTYAGFYPKIEAQDYRLNCDGLIAAPRVFTLEQLYGLSKHAEVETFHCVTGWKVHHVAWRGIDLASFLDTLRPTAAGRYVVFHSADGVYVDSLTLEQARAPGVILATHIAGQPLLRKGGYPLRLLVPQMYGYKSVKWVNRVSLSAVRPEGTWERDGYAANAYIRKGFSWSDLL